MNTIINNYHISFDPTSLIVTVSKNDEIYKIHISEMTIFPQYQDISNIELIEVLFDDSIFITRHVYEAQYYKAKGLVIMVENDAFQIFELRFD